MAGILHRSPEDRARHALEETPIRRALHRLPWLLVGLVGSAVATLVMTQFEAQLEAQVVVAFFVPAIVYLADAIGTQTEAIVVRGLSYNSPSLAHLVIGEMSAGMLIGAVLGAIAWPLVTARLGAANWPSRLHWPSPSQDRWRAPVACSFRGSFPAPASILRSGAGLSRPSSRT